MWTRLSLTHARPVRSLHVYVEYVYIHTRLQNVVNSTSNPSSHTHMLFVFTIALWDTIAELPLLPSVKQDYWGYPLLFSALTIKTKPIAVSLTHKCTKKTHTCMQSERLTKITFLPNSTAEIETRSHNKWKSFKTKGPLFSVQTYPRKAVSFLH